MTATNVFCSARLKAAFVATDAAVYSTRAVMTSYGSKMYSVAHWPGVITWRGTAVSGPLLGYNLAGVFDSFDAAVEGIEGVLPEFVRSWDFAIDKAGLDGSLRSELLIAGWSSERDCPEAYVINTSDALPVCTTAEEAEAAEHLPAPFTLHRLPDAIEGPAVTDMDLIIAADWNGVDETDIDSVAWSMGKMLEMQRQADFGDGLHWIGGFSQLSIITATGVTQRVLTRWDEDCVGELLRPTPIDWTQWHRDNPKPTPNTPIELSRVRRDMLARRGRKAGRYQGATQ